MSTSNSTSMAILDDYANIAASHFTHIPNLQVSSYPKTLNPSKSSDLSELIKRLQPYQIISCMRERTPFPSTLLKELPNLKLLLTTGVRNASIDLATCKERNITVAGTTGTRPKSYDADGHPVHDGSEAASSPPPPGYDSTTQHTWSLLLSLTSRVAIDSSRLSTDTAAWQSGFSIALGGKTLGVCGLGKLGANAARIAVLGFGMNVIAWSENLTQDKADEAAVKAGLSKGTYKAVSKDELFKQADVLSVHYVLSNRSRGVVGAKELGLMKESAVLVNTARGPLIDEKALLDTLENGKIKGAALDVWWEEPLPSDSPWRTTKWGENGRSEVVMSPHMGYVNEGTMNAWYKEQAEDVERFLKGEDVKTRIS